jgi:transcriptional regulator with XRE-family HTH domain
MIDDATRIRVVRALLGITSQEFAARVGVTPGIVTGWEKGRYTPRKKSRLVLAEICEREKIAFLPSGMPVPMDSFTATPENTNA